MKVNGWITLETGTPQVGRQQFLSTCQCLQRRARQFASSSEVSFFLAGKCLTLKLVAWHTCVKCLGWGMSRGGYFQASQGKPMERGKGNLLHSSTSSVPIEQEPGLVSQGLSKLFRHLIPHAGVDSPGLRLGGRARS